jgi:hypothetical protein
VCTLFFVHGLCKFFCSLPISFVIFYRTGQTGVHRTDRRTQDRQLINKTGINKQDRQTGQTELTDSTRETEHDRLGWTDRTGQDRIRLDRTGLDWIGQDSHRSQPGHGS